jgi:hypothetical protein
MTETLPSTDIPPLMENMIHSLDAMIVMDYEGKQRFAPGREGYSPLTLDRKEMTEHVGRAKHCLELAQQNHVTLDGLQKFDTVAISGGIRVSLSARDQTHVYQFIIHDNPQGISLYWTRIKVDEKGSPILREGGDYLEYVIHASKQQTTSELVQ